MKAVRIAISSLSLAALLFAAGTLGPLALEDASAPVAARHSIAPATAALLTAGENRKTAGLEQKVDSGSATHVDLAALALAYLQRSRAEADPTYLSDAEDLLTRSIDMESHENFPAFLGMAALSNATHDFSGSARWSRRAIDVNPYNAAPHGLLGDALFELGHIDEADAAYQRMIDIRPDVASYVRASYAAQFHGEWGAALRVMRLAVQAGPDTGEQAAFLRHQAGDIFLALGRIDRARQENRIGMRLAPGYAPPAVGVAEAMIAEGRLRAALEIMERAVKDLPALEYEIKLGDLRAALGDERGAEEAYADAAAHLEEYRANGVRPDVDFILFYADHGIRLEQGLAEARAIYANRPKSSTADVLAWMLYANGRHEEAMRYAERAMKTSPAPDALQRFHAGAIAQELGRDRRARALFREALELDPHFSLVHAPAARALLRAPRRDV